MVVKWQVSAVAHPIAPSMAVRDGALGIWARLAMDTVKVTFQNFSLIQRSDFVDRGRPEEVGC